jgi:hypothetical protein
MSLGGIEALDYTTILCIGLACRSGRPAWPGAAPGHRTMERARKKANRLP